MNRPTRMMINHLNLILEKEGSCLRYIEHNIDCGIITYNLLVVDKYISDRYINIPIITDKLEKKIRQFFEDYGIENIGFSNTVKTILVKE
ncbi:MAG: hypothetical protein RSD47_00760 [Romboutsia sp.]